MEVIIDNNTYKINIIRKPIKNMYLRVKEDLSILITCNYLVTGVQIKKFIKLNELTLVKMIKHAQKKQEKNSHVYILGKQIDVIICNEFKKPELIENKLYIKDLNQLDKYLKKYSTELFNERLEKCYNLFEERIPYPKLKIRKMKSKWGSCKKIDKTITLNLDLIKYSVSEIDYVIIHELSHLIVFNHSSSFWQYVSKYKPDYKENRKVLKE